MKKTAILITVIAVLQLLFISLWSAEVSAAARTFEIVSKTANTMEIRFQVPEFELERELVNGQLWDRVKLEETGYLIEEGKPELPILSTTIAIPNQGSVEVELLDTRTKYIQHIIPYPSQDGNIEDSPRDFRINQAYYNSTEIYPQEVIRYSEPQIMRDFRLITIQMQPFAWNPVTRELEVRERIDIRLRFTDTPGINELAGPQVISPSFAKLYESLILNFDDYRDAILSNTPPRYLIIYGAYSDATFQSKLAEFVLWKKQKGADVRLVSTAVTGASNTQIKAFIQNLYNDINSRPDFIILIGDTTGSFPVPTWPETFSSYNGKGDYPYQHLAGNDYLGDVFLGRISAENTSQLDIMLSKGYFYERFINVNTAQWLNKMLLVGDTSPSGQSTMYTNKYIKHLSLIHNPDYTFTELYSGDPSPSEMNNAMNQGVGFFNYRGYIGMSGWSPGSSLINGTKLPHAVILTCSTGNFDGGTATSEAFTRLGTASVPAGAVTATGMYTSGTHTMYNNALNMGVFTGIFPLKMRTMGESILHGKLFLHHVYNQTRPNQVKYFAHWINLIGDPTLEVFITIPKTFSANIPSALPIGTQNLDLLVVDENNLPVKDACVTISQDNIIKARAYTDESGMAYLFFNTPLNELAAVVTISMHDFKPLQSIISVAAGGSLVAANPLIDDDNVGNSIGNGNSSANSGETVELLFSVRNSTSQTISNVTGYVSSDNPHVSIISNALNFMSVDPGASNYTITPALVQISPACPTNTVVKFELNLTDAEDNPYLITSYITVTDAFMLYLSSQVSDTNNQLLDPNETVSFAITVRNTGSVPVSDLYGQLMSLNDLVMVPDNTGYFGNIMVGMQSTTTQDAFQLHGRTQLLPGTVIPMRLRLYNAAGYIQWLHFSLTVGQVSSTDPLGPDAYGYVIYDVTDTGYDDCPTYQWIGIAPAEGGQGIALPITDIGVTNDEGDPVGAQSLAVVDLPFSFRFYGENYNQITVCSNGFIAMGVTENANYRNFRLPATVWGGGGAPSPLIAPFWDDLSTSGGGIFKWYDSVNHLFIIEWYNLKNGYVQTAVETFQVILYDPAHYPTSLGDGPIKIQYHTFNNVDTGSTANEYSGNYATIGIQNYDQTIGLEYSFNNTYPVAAAPLSHQKALYITTAPIYYYNPHLIYDSAYVLDNNNNVLEPGETVNLYVNLMNIGEETATNINASISTTSPYVTIQGSSATYPTISNETIEANLMPFRISVSPDCPDKQQLPFVINITTDDNYWQRSFNLIVEKPSMAYNSFIVVDAEGNMNGVADPGETVKLVVQVENSSLVSAHDLTAALTTSSLDVSITNPVLQRQVVAAGEILQLPYEIVINPSVAANTPIPFTFNLISSDAPAVTKAFTLHCGTSGSIVDFEASDGNFISQAGWVYGAPTITTPSSGSNLWATNLTGQYPNNAMFILLSPEITLGADPMLTFWHHMNCQNYYDGGNVSISTNGGASWNLLYPVGGYNTTLNVWTLGEVGYTNIVNWSQATFNLSQYADQTVTIRWRFGSNASVQGLGWFIDDVMISGNFIPQGMISGTVTLSSEIDPSLVKIKSNNNIVTNPSSEGDYAMYLPQGTYNLKAQMQYHTEQSTPEIELSNTQLTHVYNFALDYLSSPTDLAYSGAYGDSIVFLTWNAPEPGEYIIQSYNVYRRYQDHPFMLVGQSTDTSFSEELEIEGTYEYYIRARYDAGESALSNLISIAFPFVSVNNDVIPVIVNALNANYPNPFNPTTTISFSVAKAGDVSLKIYNTKGQLVKTLQQGEKSSGMHKVVWDGTSNNGKAVSSGVYLYKLETTGYSKTRKMMLMK